MRGRPRTALQQLRADRLVSICIRGIGVAPERLVLLPDKRLGLLQQRPADQNNSRQVRERRMRELTPETITDAVVDQMATMPDPRLKAIMKQSRRNEPAPAGSVRNQAIQPDEIIQQPGEDPAEPERKRYTRGNNETQDISRRRDGRRGGWTGLTRAGAAATDQDRHVHAADRRACRRRQGFAARDRNLARRRQRQGRPARPQGRADRL